MKIRPVYISNSHKLEMLSEQYSVVPEFIFVGQILYKLSDLSPAENMALDNIQSENIRIYNSRSGNDHLLQVLSRSINHKMFAQIKSSALSEFINQYNDFFNLDNKKPAWQIRNKTLDFNKSPFIMGILNVTPDSFSDGGSYLKPESAVYRALQMADAGADIIDIGGESTRPGADPVTFQEELDRVIPVIRDIRERSDILISIDTYKSEIAAQALNAGADLVNDISGCVFDQKMKEIVKQYDCPVVIMHIKGTPKNMQQNPEYNDVCAEISDFFEERIDVLTSFGINKIILDPGIGFGKKLYHNLQILQNLREFTWLGMPLLVGASRKSFIGTVLGRDVSDRLAGSLTAAQSSIISGTDIVRVHDVKETTDVVKLINVVRDS